MGSDNREVGWVRIHRRLLSSLVFQDPDLLKIWLWILLKASRKDYAIPVPTGKGMTIVTLKPGQIVFGRKNASDELRSPAETVRDRMMRLKRFGMVTIQPATHYSVVTVVNWAFYQDGLENPATQSARQSATQPPTNRHKQESREGKEADLFPDAPASGALSGKGNGKVLRKARKEYPPAVYDIYQAYTENIFNIPAKKADALRNIAARIKEGHTPEQLIGAVERYFKERQGNPDALPYHANNFFGQKAYFLGYLPDQKVIGGCFDDREKRPAAKDAGLSSENRKILGYDTVGRPLYATPSPSEVAQ